MVSEAHRAEVFYGCESVVQLCAVAARLVCSTKIAHQDVTRYLAALAAAPGFLAGRRFVGCTRLQMTPTSHVVYSNHCYNDCNGYRH
jgi:hypothetical protein